MEDLVKLIFEQMLPAKHRSSILILILICFVVQLAGCTKASGNSVVTQEVQCDEDSEQDTVLLSSVTPPQFGKRFAVLYAGNDSTNVFWGYSASITGSFFWADSSYPGFGYTILIQDDYFSKSNSIVLSTLYGTYEYEFVQEYDVFIENGKLISHQSGDEVNQLLVDTEQLAVYSEITHMVYEYKLVKGTKINIE